MRAIFFHCTLGFGFFEAKIDSFVHSTFVETIWPVLPKHEQPQPVSGLGKALKKMSKFGTPLGDVVVKIGFVQFTRTLWCAGKANLEIPVVAPHSSSLEGRGS